jgi:hypothetical protein
MDALGVFCLSASASSALACVCNAFFRRRNKKYAKPNARRAAEIVTPAMTPTGKMRFGDETAALLGAESAAQETCGQASHVCADTTQT